MAEGGREICSSDMSDLSTGNKHTASDKTIQKSSDPACDEPHGTTRATNEQRSSPKVHDITDHRDSDQNQITSTTKTSVDTQPDAVSQTSGIQLLSAATDEELSRIASTALECMGYSQPCIDEREEVWRTLFESFNPDPGLLNVIVGSTGEGLSPFYQGDIDKMVIYRGAVWLDDSCLSQQVHIDRNMKVAPMHTQYAPPGYAYLYVPGPNPELFSSKDFHESSQNDIEGPSLSTFTRRSGPADTFTTKMTSMDEVFALKCICPNLTESWQKRERPHEWPPADLIDEVVQLDVHVVPVGCKGHLGANDQWRICYTFGEKRLIKSLPLPVKKVYVILKKINGFELSVCKEVTSYVLKNIVFWVAELTPNSLFTDDNIVKLVLTSLSVLRHSIISGRLPSYMIPERNLFFAAKCCGLGKELCYNAITKLLEKGGSVLQVWPQIWEEMQCLSRGEDAEARYSKYCLMHSIHRTAITSGPVSEGTYINNFQCWYMLKTSGVNTVSTLLKTIFNVDIPTLDIPLNCNAADTIDRLEDWLLSYVDHFRDHLLELPTKTQLPYVDVSQECPDGARGYSGSVQKRTCRVPQHVFDMFTNSITGAMQEMRDASKKENTSADYRDRAMQILYNKLYKNLWTTLKKDLGNPVTTEGSQTTAGDKCLSEPSTSVSVIYSRTGDTNRQIDESSSEAPSG